MLAKGNIHIFIVNDINKVDLADAVGADADKMVADAQRLNPNVKVIKSSLKQGCGLDEIIEVIEEAMNN